MQESLYFYDLSILQYNMIKPITFVYFCREVPGMLSKQNFIAGGRQCYLLRCHVIDIICTVWKSRKHILGLSGSF